MVRFQNSIHRAGLALVLLMSASFLGCTRESKDSKISMVIPQFTSTAELNYAPMVSSKSVNAQSTTNFNSLLNPATLSEFNCFIVFVGGPGYEGGGSCTVSDGTSFKLGGFAGGMKSGEVVEMNVPSGAGREIVLVGFKTDDVSVCKDFHAGMPQAALSEPFVLARQTKSLSSGTVSVDLSPSSMTAKISNCQFANDSGGGGAYYGSGTDGDLSVSGIQFLSSLMNGSSQYYLSMSMVNSIVDNGNGTAEITVQDSWNTSSLSHVKQGDEIMLYVVGGSEGSPGGCNQVYPGFSTSGVVTFAQADPANGKQFRMLLGDSRWLSITAANLLATASGPTPQTFCRIVAMRVPHFNNIDLSGGDLDLRISSGGNTDMSTTSFANMGVLPIRVKGQILIPNATTMIFDVTGRGYKSGTGTNPVGQSHQGQLTGYSSTMSAFGAGGGYDGGIACGGGGGGRGGCPSNASLAGDLIGDEYGCNIFDATKSCLRGKFFMGGGGGGDTTPGGGHGGGALRLTAKSIFNDGTMTVWAKGASAVSFGDDGGGGGGSIYVVADSVSGSGGFNFNAYGGNAFASSGYGAVGGGGRVHVVFKSSTFTGGASFSVSKGTSGESAGAQDGTCLSSGINLVGCAVASTP